ncbi:MAG: hypothetical protein P8Y01_12105 [Woeseiaceae bacterium]
MITIDAETAALVVLIAAILGAGIYGAIMKHQRLKTFGDYPPILLKFFSKREYADQFLAGSVRFGLLEYYASIEDKARKDAGEGQGHFAAPSKSVTTVHLDRDGKLLGPNRVHRVAAGDIGRGDRSLAARPE